MFLAPSATPQIPDVAVPKVRAAALHSRPAKAGMAKLKSVPVSKAQGLPPVTSCQSGIFQQLEQRERAKERAAMAYSRPARTTWYSAIFNRAGKAHPASAVLTD